MSEPEIAMRAVGVSKRYARVTALADVSVAIGAGTAEAATVQPAGAVALGEAALALTKIPSRGRRVRGESVKVW